MLNFNQTAAPDGQEYEGFLIEPTLWSTGCEFIPLWQFEMDLDTQNRGRAKISFYSTFTSPCEDPLNTFLTIQLNRCPFTSRILGERSRYWSSLTPNLDPEHRATEVARLKSSLIRDENTRQTCKHTFRNIRDKRRMHFSLKSRQLGFVYCNFRISVIHLNQTVWTLNGLMSL